MSKAVVPAKTKEEQIKNLIPRVIKAFDIEKLIEVCDASIDDLFKRCDFIKKQKKAKNPTFDREAYAFKDNKSKIVLV